MTRPHYKIVLPLTIVAITTSVFIAQLVMTSCGGDSNSSSNSFESLPEGFQTLEGKSAATLTDDQAMALEAIMKSRKQLGNRASYHYNSNLTGIKGDGYMVCSSDSEILGGKIRAEQGHVQANTTRVDDLRMKSDASADLDVTYLACRQETMTFVTGLLPVYTLDGKIHGVHSSSAQTSYNSDAYMQMGSGVAIDTLDGTIQAKGSGDHTIVLSDFSVANRWSRALYDEYKIITADPLGDEQVRAGKLDFFSKIIGCKGGIKIDGQDYACTAVARQLLERAIAR